MSLKADKQRGSPTSSTSRGNVVDHEAPGVTDDIFRAPRHIRPEPGIIKVQPLQTSDMQVDKTEFVRHDDAE